MFRTLPGICELFADILAGKTSEAAALLPVPRPHAMTTPTVTSCDFWSCEIDNRPTMVVAPSDRIVPKLTPHMEENRVAPAVDLACVEDNEEFLCVNVELVDEALWKKFHVEGNEMIVTKPGRSMFPIPDFKISGLSPYEDYKLEIQFVFVDEFRYRFCSPRNVWFRTLPDPIEPTSRYRRSFEHPMSPNAGAILSEGKLSFEKLRGTSYLRPAENMIYLPTMRKYQIQLVITELHSSHTRCFDFPVTEFIAVSNYKNMKVKQLKIDYNPYAKAFREEYKRSVVIPFKSSKPKLQAKQENRKRKREDNSRTRVREATADLTPAHLSPGDLTPADLSPGHLTPADLSPGHLTPVDLSPAHLSPGDLSPDQPCTSKQRTHGPAASPIASGIPTGYIDLTDYTSISIHQQNETIVSPTDHATYSALQAMELHAGHYPPPAYSHSYFSSPPAWPTPNTYYFYKDNFTRELNTSVAYNYSYNSYRSCNFDDDLDSSSSVDEIQGLVACALRKPSV